MSAKSKKLTFTPPQGMKIPDGKNVGDTFEAPAMFEVEDGGRLCLKAVNGMKLEAYEKEAESGTSKEDEFMAGLEQEYANQKTA